MITLRIGKLIALLVLAGALAAAPSQRSFAQDTYRPEDAIAFVASLPDFAQGLEATEGWTAQAYNTRNGYGIWRVTFWNADGEEVGIADVSLERNRVYSAETYFYPSESIMQGAQDTIVEFVRNQPEVQELLDNPWDHDMYLDFNPWVFDGAWSVWIDNGSDPLYALVRPDNSSTFSTDNLQLIRVGFGNIMSWEDWRSANTSSAASIAFSQEEIASRMRDLPGWTSHAEPIDGGVDGVWWVGFYSGDFLAADAMINLVTGELLSYTTY